MVDKAIGFFPKAVPLEFFVEFPDASDAEVLEIRAVPIHIESGQGGLDDVRIFYAGDAHVPLQSVGLGGLGQVG